MNEYEKWAYEYKKSADATKEQIEICEYNEEAEHDDAPDSLSSIVRLLWQRKNENESGLR